MAPLPERLTFGEFELDVAAYELRRHGRRVRLERQPMDLLILLVERRPQLVLRSDIAERLWGKDVFVDVEAAVNTAIRKIRQALRDSPEAPRFVETVLAKGYRFIAPVAVDSGESSGLQATEPADSASPLLPTTPDVIAEDQTAIATAVTGSNDAPGARRTHRQSRTRLTVGLFVVTLFGGVMTWSWLRSGRDTLQVRLAVLPFANLTGDAEREYLADGLAEETIASLGQVDPGHISVIGRTSSMAYTRTTKSLAEIGRELGADYLVESSIRAEGGRLRVTSKLIRARDQVQVWAASYDRAPAGMLKLQREVSSAIAEQVRLRLSPERTDALERRQTRNADAYDFYLRGRHFENQRTPETIRRAIAYYQRATALDPDYALAWSGLADAYSASTLNSDALPLEVAPLAREAAAQAVRAEPNLAETQTSLGMLEFFLDWDWPAAEGALRRAIALDPSYAMAHRRLGHLLSQTGRHDEARSALRRARELDPLYAMNYAISSQVAFQARDYSGALEHARQAIVLDPEFWIGDVQAGQVYEQLGQVDLASEALTKAARFSGGNSRTISLRGHLLAKAGRTQEAREVLSALETVSRQRYVPPYAMALVHAGLGDREAVFEWLDKAYAARDVHLVFLPVDPKWDPYRADPQFGALIAQCGFTGTARTGPVAK